jgi:hypothetical protein
MAKNVNTKNNGPVSYSDVGSRLRAEQETVQKQTARNVQRHEATLERLDRRKSGEA